MNKTIRNDEEIIEGGSFKETNIDYNYFIKYAKLENNFANETVLHDYILGHNFGENS